MSNQEDFSVEDQAVYCKLGVDTWHKAVCYNDAGISILDTEYSFFEIWNLKGQKQPFTSTEIIEKSWQELLLPLPESQIDCWAYALTYGKHQKETSMQESFRFTKSGPAHNMFSSIAYRPHLDYEAEIGILLNKNCSDRFGYVMVNDLTDRGIQARTFDRKNPAPGFSKSKSFEGSLRVGPLLLLGDDALWNDIEITLLLNSEIRQHVYGRECLISPRQFHHDTFSTGKEEEWMLIASGTSGGTLFHTPKTFDKLVLFAQSGFKRNKAVERWLSTLHFLTADDEIEFRSSLLGIGKTQVNNER